MKSRKILFVHENCGRRGGAEENMLATAQAVKGRYDCSLLCTHHTGNEEYLFEEAFGDIHTMDWEEDEGLLRQKIALLVEAMQPDLVYVHKCQSAPILEALVEMSVPSLRMVHDHEVYCMRTYKYFPWSRKTCHRKAGLCCLLPCMAFIKRDRSNDLGIGWVSYRKQQRLIKGDQQLSGYIVASQYMYDELALQGYAMSKVTIIPPVPPESLPQQRQAPPSHSHTIVFVGQVVRGKGLDCLIKALADVKAPFKLLVLGDGSAMPYCQRLAETLGLSQRIEFLGFIPNEEVGRHLNSARLGVVPSVWPEPFGMVGIEMMRHGVPVVAFASGGIGDWLEDDKTGYLVAPLDVKMMAKKVELLLTDDKLADEMGAEGTRRCRERFGFGDYITKLEEKWEQIQGLKGA